jgi:DNA processing protein
MNIRRALRDDEKRAWLRLARTETIGPATFASLVARFPNAREALDAAPRLARRGGKDNLRIPSEADAQAEMDALARMGGRLLASIEPEFPSGLAALEPPPAMISVVGNVALLERDMVGIVGARNASALGIKFANRLAADLGSAGLIIASGMARGIDHAAHSGSLDTGTVAVLAGGVDTVYPPEHQALYDQLRERGALVSEMPFGMAPLSRHFPRRNRLISGLSRGVVVIEAAERSGSLITANYALEQGREVFAVPGSPLDPRSRGANRLIREGATLTEGADDVLSLLRPILGHAFRESPHEETPLHGAEETLVDKEADRFRALVEEKLGPAPVDVDELIRQCGVPPAVILTVLLELELAGRVQRHPGNRVAWR